MADESNAVIEKVIPNNTVKKQIPLSEDQLLEIWKQDEYWGIGGSYSVDPFTGKRTPIEG